MAGALLRGWWAWAAVATALVFTASPTAWGQFGTPGSTQFRERIVGDYLPGASGPQPEEGDQIGAFFQDQLAGVYTFPDGNRAFSVTIFGDDPESPDVTEGPRAGQRVQFRYFDVSTNEVVDLTVVNRQGEAFNFTFQGVEVIEVPGLPLDFTPVRQFDVRASPGGGDGDGGGTGGGGGGDGGGGGAPGNPDINRDGDVNTRDAAIVLRFIAGGGVQPGSTRFRDLGIMISGGSGTAPDPGDAVMISADELGNRCDVDGDGDIDTRDAVEILKQRG